MQETKPQLHRHDHDLLMAVLWKDSVGGATYSDLIATLDGFFKMPLPQDELAKGLTCLETAGLIRVTRERVVPTERARTIYRAVQETRGSPDYALDPARYGGEKLARIVASGATKSYEEFELLSQALRRKFAVAPARHGDYHPGIPHHPLYSEELYREAQKELHERYREVWETWRRSDELRREAQKEPDELDREVQEPWLQRMWRWLTD